MSELYTSDVPAIPDPDFVYQSKLHDKKYFDADARRRESMQDGAPPLEYDYYAERTFDFYDAQSFINNYAVYDDDGRLNIDLTSIKLGIPYDFDMSSINTELPFSHGCITGLPGHERPRPLPKTAIHLNQSKQFYQATYGHEVGHYFWRVIMARGEEGNSRDEEDFCDYFGRRMAYPTKALEEYEQIDGEALLEITARFRGEFEDTVLALMEVGKLPPRVAFDSYYGIAPNPDLSEKVVRNIHCLHCSKTGGDFNCPDADKPTPLFDFTDRAWGGSIGGYCGGGSRSRPDVMSKLTKYYQKTETQLVLFRPGWLGNTILDNNEVDDGIKPPTA